MTPKDDPPIGSTLDADWAGATMKRDSDDARDVELPSAPPLERASFAERYRRDRLLGEGGMGTVLLYQDRQIGRRVAMKVIRHDQASDPQAGQRFLREAMVQGQLEHPSVVPVYDLGVDPEGAVYFTMKRVRGVTLSEIIDGLRTEPGEFSAAYSRRRLLTAFSSVCLAIDFAHERGVLHRDLKPGNLMLGHYGEVYVLDWGLARLRGTAGADASAPIELSPRPLDRTLEGAVLGTPGYMSPEQVRGEHDAAGPASDVYALGAILFELLTLEPLHRGRSVEALLRETLAGAEARPSLRAPEREVPVELEKILLQATALDPAARHRSARGLQEELERYLDGERDLERRALQADTHARAAMELAELARTERDHQLENRRRAMREVGRALALDPGNALAGEAMVKVLSEPPAHLPPEVELELERSTQQQVRSQALIGGVTYLSMLLYLPFFFWCGVRDWRWVIAFYSLSLAASAFSFWTLRSRTPSDRNVLVVMFLSNAALASTGSVFGALFLTPSVLAVNTMAFALHLRRAHRVYAVATGCAAMLILLALQLASWLPVGYSFGPRGLTVTPGAIDFPRLPTLVFLSVLSIGVVLTAALPITRVREALAAMEQRLHLYTWHLRQMVPEETAPPSDLPKR